MVTSATIRIVRAYLNLTQAELAQRIGVSAGSVSSVENGTSRVTSEFAKKFKRAVGITDAVLIDIQYLQTVIAE
ncbi:helix-turn-helix transcriptional regulator [Bacillus sp. ISL-40]|uniref:helix-turn-helix transcriptional regulator n=1 Tax=Bacillus sp. ISL-40 TaxID=2819126 RepID=UPI001BEC99CF|nr:helix-turn-helix transcriptional regulator [Bacillus sp. ISL-40]MBT2700426.1 helix-turn-helix transcriptional regulator [Bacillus sp. ISL-40]